MANEVKDIYRAIEELNKRVDKLTANGSLEQRVQKLEDFAQKTDNYVASLERAIKSTITPLKQLLGFFNF